MGRLNRAVFAVLLATAVARADGIEGELVRRWEFNAPQAAEGWVPAHDLKDFRVSEGMLGMTSTGPDAFLLSPGCDEQRDGLVIYVWMGADAPGVNEVFWTTRDAPEFSQRLHAWQEKPIGGPVSTSRPREVGVYRFVIDGAAGGDARLTRFRIDPFNGKAGTRIWIQAVELRRLPPVLDATVSFDTHRVKPGATATLSLHLRQVAGRALREEVALTLPDGTSLQAPVGDERLKALAKISPPSAGVIRTRLTAALANPGPVYDLEASTIAGADDTLPIAATIQTEQVRVEFIKAAEGDGVAAARWMVAAGPERWRLAGWLMPLAHVVYQAGPNRTVSRDPALTITKHFTDTVRLEGFLDPQRQLRTTVLFSIRSAGKPHQVAVTTALEAAANARLLDFSGPTVLADREAPGDPLDRYALFGGLEFLEPGWRSSSDRAVGDRFAERWSPSPHKITLPLMAVEAQGLTTGMMWRPAPSDDINNPGPWATFVSPNFLAGQTNHRMTLALAAPRSIRQENESCARFPMPIPPEGLNAVWQYILHAEPHLPVAMMAKRWYEAFGPPAPARPPHDDATAYNLIARNFGETMWWPEEKGWRHHWYHLETRSSAAPDMAAELIAHAMVTGETRWLEPTSLKSRSILDAAGSLESRLSSHGQAHALIASMRPDGTWAFQNTPDMRAQTRQFTNGKYDSLGEDGSTSLGTCVQSALPILRYAEISGDGACIQAGLKALAAMRQFKVPRGAQVWEVHQQIPDIRAAALAVEACQLGYRLTGDQGWLEDANYWGWAGVSFIYSWPLPTDRVPGGMVASRDKRDPNRSRLPMSAGFENPQRQIMPYATVPVLGPTFYVVNWFGVVVQWCGLEWAQHVIELDADRPDPLLRAIADGVVASGQQQMFDQPPWTGLYPDVWDVESNTAQGALIYSGLPLRCLQAQARIPAWTRTWTRVVRSQDDKRVWHVSGWGNAPLLSPPASPWSVLLTALPNQPTELIIAPVDKAKQILQNEELIPEAAGASNGWRYLPDRRAIIVRLTPTEKQCRLKFQW